MGPCPDLWAATTPRFVGSEGCGGTFLKSGRVLTLMIPYDLKFPVGA